MWKLLPPIAATRHLGAYRTEPTENLHPGDVYQNKVTGFTYQWCPGAGSFPEIGQKCIYDPKERDECNASFVGAEVIFISLCKCSEGKDVAVIEHATQGLAAFFVEPYDFRAAKTERELAVDELSSIIESLRFSFGADKMPGALAEALYNAGYRKVGS